MLTLLQKWNGAVEINGSNYDNIQAVTNSFKAGGNEIHIKLYPNTKQVQSKVGKSVVEENKTDKEYKIFVKQYMTKPASPTFDFMAKYNQNEPMPFRMMIGKKIKETKGMVYMELHADITEKQATTCMCCGKKLTNPVSQYFGIGPECGNHNYINPFDTEEELLQAVNDYRKKLKNVTWSGWVIKSAIIEEVEI